jgi:hypothetical protein
MPTKETAPANEAWSAVQREAKVMFFLMRTAFWFSLVLLVLPFGGTGEDRDEAVNPIQALSAARDAVGDITAICERKPDVCETGKSAFQTIGVRARESAKIAYELLDEQFSEPDPSIQTGGIPAIIDAAASDDAAGVN